MLSPSRRSVLKALGVGTLAGAMAPSTVMAAPGGDPSTRKFVFVFASGGWDPAFVFAPNAIASPDVVVDGGSEVRTAGNIDFIHNDNRPSVTEVFERYYEDLAVLNGLFIPSMNHRQCERLMLTGVTDVGRADWPSLIAAADPDRGIIPSVVLSGPSHPGQYSQYSSYVGKFDGADSLLDGSAIQRGDLGGLALPGAYNDVIDAHLSRRVIARSDSAQSDDVGAMATAYEQAHERLGRLKDQSRTLRLSSGDSVYAQAGKAVELLQEGVCRCVSFGSGGWDSHAKTLGTQRTNYEALFTGLARLLNLLSNTVGISSPRMLDETIVVVMSEMGRSPWLAGDQGKNHWPFTSVLLAGGGLVTNQVVGGYDSSLTGLEIDPVTGTTGTGAYVTPAQLGATLLDLGAVERPDYLADEAPLSVLVSE